LENENTQPNNRDFILSSALTLFSQRGFSAVSVREITEMAKISKPTLYYYFGNKEGLLRTIIAENFEPFLSVLEAASSYHGDLPLSLDKVVDVYFNFAEKNPVFYCLLLTLENAPSQSEAYEVVAPFLDRQYQLLETLFEQAVENHGNMEGRKYLYAMGLLSLIHSVIARFYRSKEESLSAQLKFDITRQFSYGIYS
jgi:TetR/AcrR family transcriptional regulator